MMITRAVFDELDLTAPRTHAELDLGGVWRRLRSEAPVCWHPPTATHEGFWLVTRHADLVDVYRDPARFTSVRGNVLDTVATGGDSASGLMLPVSDGPRHRAIRRTLGKGLSPRALAPVAAAIRSAVRGLLAEAVRRGSCEFALDVAAKVPLAAICDLLGVPAADRALVFELTSHALGSEAPDQELAETLRTRQEILVYFAKAAAQRRRSPSDDVIGLLTNCVVDGQPLTEAEIVMNCYSLVLGGDETARLAMTGSVQAFLDHPDQWKRLLAGEVAISRAVEELLRWTTPAMHVGRTATEDVDLRGQRIQAGEPLALWNISANFDESVFADPEILDLSRSPNPHLTFGFGPHFCVGGYLGRVELTALLEGLTALAPTLAPAGPTAPIYSNFLNGLTRLPVALR